MSSTEKAKRLMREQQGAQFAPIESLILTEQLLRRVLDGAPLSMFATDERGVFTLHRGSVLTKLGMKQGANVGRSAFELFGKLPIEVQPDGVVEASEVIKRVLAGETLRGETQLNGMVFENQFAPLKSADGQVIGLVGVAFDITDRKEVERELRRSHLEVRGLAARLSAVDELDRKRIAANLHDAIGQSLSVAGLNLAILEQELPEGTPPEALRRLRDLAGMLKETFHTLREVIAELRPPMLDQFGLVATLRWLAEQYAGRTGLQVEVSGQDLQPPLPESVATPLLRIAQEALNNVAKHAGASRATIAISEVHRQVTMIVTDDGQGFDPMKEQRPAKSWGLAIMRERALGIGAELRIRSSPNTGASIVVTWPRPAATSRKKS